MKKTNNNINLFILASGIIAAIIFSIPSIIYSAEIFRDGKTLDKLSSAEIQKLKFIFIEFVHYIIIFSIIVKFNVSWIKNLFHYSTSTKKRKIVLLISTNLVLFFVFKLLGMILLNFIYELTFTKMFYWAIYGNNLLMITAYLFSYILNTNIKSRVAEIENIKLKEVNIAAELASLKEQISPHFFFNTLSSLSTVIRLQTKEDSLKFVENLSNVYRYILESSEQNLIKFEDEINFLEDYFYLLKNRFGDKIELEKDISRDYYNTFIPPMALQLLVENAIQHNVISNESHLKISMSIDDKYIVVSNIYHKKSTSENFGVGLANLSKRYKLITNKDIIIEQNEKSFTVKLPVI